MTKPRPHAFAAAATAAVVSDGAHVKTALPCTASYKPFLFLNALSIIESSTRISFFAEAVPHVPRRSKWDSMNAVWNSQKKGNYIELHATRWFLWQVNEGSA